VVAISKRAPLCVPRRSRSEPLGKPAWIRTLSMPVRPPRMFDDFDWRLIEHIRMHGRISDSCPFGNSSIFELPVYESDDPLPRDGNAVERTENERLLAEKIARDEEVEEEIKRARSKKEDALEPKEIARRLRHIAQRKREKEEWNKVQAQQEAEYRRLGKLRQEEAERRRQEYAEWDRIGAENRERAQREEHQRIVAAEKAAARLAEVLRRELNDHLIGDAQQHNKDLLATMAQRRASLQAAMADAEASNHMGRIARCEDGNFMFVPDEEEEA
jgi:hypothetical protein